VIEGSIARRYALALFELAQSKGEVESVGSDLDRLQQLVKASPELRAILANETLPARRKKDALNVALQQIPSRYLRNFIFLLVDKHRETHLAGIAQRYHELADEARGVVEVELRSAVELPQPVVDQIRTGLAGRLNKTVRLESVVQKDLIGGVVVRVGDQLLDASLKSRLLRLKKRMAEE